MPNPTRTRTPLVTLALVLPAAVASAHTLHPDIHYYDPLLPGVDPNLLALDVYAPDDADGTNPVMMMFHGGSFISGDKNGDERLVHPKMDYYTDSFGWVFVNVNYRLTDITLPAGHPDQVTHPDHVVDAARAVAWTIENIASYGGDPGRLVLMGHSAGAQLVALIATDGARLAAEGHSISAIGGVVALDGMYDVPYRYEQSTTPPAYMQLVWGVGLSTQQDMSPALHVDPGEDVPPMLIVHEDRDINIEQSVAFVDALTNAGHDAEAYNAIGKTHADIGGDVGTVGDPLTIKVDEFLDGLALTPPGCQGDIDGDGSTDVFDFALLAAGFGAGPGATPAMGDLNGDGYVDVFDFALLAGGFGCGAGT